MRFTLLRTLTLLAVLPVLAAAQTPSSTDPATVQLAPVEVTGSRLRSFAGEIDVNSLISFDRNMIEEQGVQSIGDLKNLIPQLSVAGGNAFSGAITSGTSIDGIANFQLRGLTGNATLVLVDGRRLARTRQTGVGSDYDIYGIPISAIERIEVLPDGGSSVYGSDAIGGVVNIILRKGYRGSEFELAYENTFRSDAHVTRYNLTSGYAVGKLNVNVTANYETQASLAAVDRWWTVSNDRRFIGGGDSRSQFPLGGRIRVTTGTFPGTTTNVLRIPAGSNGRTVTAQDYLNAGVPTDTERYDSAKHTNLINESRRQAYTLRTDYRWREWARPRFDFRWNRAINFGKGDPLGGVQSPTIPAGRPGNPFAVPILVDKFFWEFGYADRKYTTTDTSVVAGLDGTLPRGWRYSANIQFQKKEPSIEETINQWNTALLNAAIADPAQTVIVAHDSRVGPANPTGALDAFFFLNPAGEPNRVWTYDLKADGGVYELPAGAIQTAFGFEAREDYVKFVRRLQNDTTQAAEPKSKRTAQAYFAEVKVPVFSDKKYLPLLRSLTVSGATRYDDYSTGASAQTISNGLSWRPLKWLAFRGNRNEGFKVPLLFETDRNASTVATTFGTTGTFVLFDTARNEQLIGTVQRFLGGNPKLEPEESESLNGGVAIDVPFVKGLTFDVSFWNTEIRNQVNTLTNYQDFFTLFPERFVRDPATAAGGLPGRITYIDNSPVNISLRLLSGYDTRLSYTYSSPRLGRFTLNAGATKQTRNRSYLRPGANGLATVGLANRPLRATGNLNWSRGPWGAGVTHIWQEGYRTSVTAGPDWPVYTNWNGQVSYNFSKSALGTRKDWIGRAFDRARLQAAVMNVLDEGLVLSPTGGVAPYLDPRLRRYTITLRKGF